jgi:hypothetical protein
MNLFYLLNLKHSIIPFINELKLAEALFVDDEVGNLEEVL